MSKRAGNNYSGMVRVGILSYSLQMSKDGRRLGRLEDILERTDPAVAVVHAECYLCSLGHARRARQERSLSAVDVQLQFPVF